MNDIKKEVSSNKEISIESVLEELDELKKISLNCFDKNGNPNVSCAIKAVQTKAKILSSFQNTKKANTLVQMGEVKIDGIQLKLNIGEDSISD